METTDGQHYNSTAYRAWAPGSSVPLRGAMARQSSEESTLICLPFECFASVLLVGLAVVCPRPPCWLHPSSTTGPAEDAAFVRFVAAVPGAVEVASGATPGCRWILRMPPTSWQLVRAKVALKATLNYAGGKQDAEVTVQPSEFVTLAVVPDEKGGWQVGVGRENRRTSVPTACHLDC